MIPINSIAAATAAGSEAASKRGDLAGKHAGDAKATTVVHSEAAPNKRDVEETKVVVHAKESRQTERDEEHLPQDKKDQNQQKHQHRKLDIMV